jgi:DNA helicase-2/ATP-dependent DNA helicase PcrA
MPEVDEILNNEKSLVIAPAGYGKTHFITSCVSKASSKHLILTHTHAGVASLRQKLKKANIEPKQYNVETITSFAQKYVFAYSDQSQLPPQEKSKEYYPYIIEKAIEILSSSHIKSVIKASYSMLLVVYNSFCKSALCKGA